MELNEQNSHFWMASLVKVTLDSTNRRGLLVNIDDDLSKVQVRTKSANGNRFVEDWYDLSAVKLLVESEMLSFSSAKNPKQLLSGEAITSNCDLWCIVNASRAGDAVLYGSLEHIGGYSEGLLLEKDEPGSVDDGVKSGHRCIHAKLNLGKKWSDFIGRTPNGVGLVSMCLKIGKDEIVARNCLTMAHPAAFLVDGDLVGEDLIKAGSILLDKMFAVNSASTGTIYLDSIRALFHQSSTRETFSFIRELCVERILVQLEGPKGAPVHAVFALLWILGTFYIEWDIDKYGAFLQRYTANCTIPLQLIQTMDPEDGKAFIGARQEKTKVYRGWEDLVVASSNQDGTPFQYLATVYPMSKVCPEDAGASNCALRILSVLQEKGNKQALVNSMNCVFNLDDIQSRSDAVRMQYQLLLKLCRERRETLDIVCDCLKREDVCQILTGQLNRTIADLCLDCNEKELNMLFDEISSTPNTDIADDKPYLVWVLVTKNPHFASWEALTGNACLEALKRLHSLRPSSAPPTHQFVTRPPLNYQHSMESKLVSLCNRAKAMIIAPEKNVVGKAVDVVTSSIREFWNSVTKNEGANKNHDLFSESAELVGKEVLCRVARLGDAVPDVFQTNEFASGFTKSIYTKALPKDASSLMCVKYLAIAMSQMDGDGSSVVFRRALVEKITALVKHDPRSSGRHHLIAFLAKQLRSWDPDVVGTLIISIASMDYEMKENIEMTAQDLFSNCEAFLVLLSIAKELKSSKLSRYCNRISMAVNHFAASVVNEKATVQEVIHANSALDGIENLLIFALSPEKTREIKASIKRQIAVIESINTLKEAYRSSVTPISSRFTLVDEAWEVLGNNSLLRTPSEYQQAISSCCFGCEENILRVHELIHSILFEGILDDQIEGHSLNILSTDNIPKKIITEILPSALDEVRKCVDLLRNGTLTRHHAQLWFARIQTKLSYELTILSKFSLSHWDIRFDASRQQDLIRDFFFVDQCIDGLRALIKFRSDFSELLFKSVCPQEDVMYVEVKGFLEEFNTSQENQLLSSVMELSANYRDSLNRLTPLNSLFLKTLSADVARSKMLLSWLSDFHNDEKFRTKSDLFRECETSPELRLALSCLVSIRTKVTKPLFHKHEDAEKNAFQGLRSFVTALSGIDLDHNRIKELSDVLKSFGSLAAAMTSQTQSPGVKAFWKLVSLRHKGVYKLRTAPETGGSFVEALILRGGRGCLSSSANSILPEDIEEILTLRDLQRLHRLILMTEIQPELAHRIVDETGADIGTLVDSFRNGEVSILASVQELLMNMAIQGHPVCSSRNGRTIFVSCDGDALGALKVTKEDFMRMKQGFTQGVELARRRCGFLNFFTITELHQIADEVINISQGNSDADSLARFMRFASRRDVPISDLPDATLNEQAQRLQELRTQLDSDQGVARYMDNVEAVLAHLGSLDTSCNINEPFAVELLRRSEGCKGNIQVDLPQDEFWLALHDKGKERPPVAIASFPNEHDAFQALWGVYARRGGIPEPSEVLLCESGTSVEQIDVFLHRWESCHCQAWQFALVGVEQLSFEAQNLLCRRVLSHRPSVTGSAFLLMMHTSGNAATGTKQSVLNALSHLQVSVQVPSDHSASHALRESLEKIYGENSVFFVESPSSGSGKTRFVFKQVSQIDAKEKCYSAVIPVMIGEYCTRTDVGERLLQAQQSLENRTKRKLVFHIDVAHRTPRTITNILVELLVINHLSWPSQHGNCSCAFDRRSGDVFAVELQVAAERPHSLDALVGSLFSTHHVKGDPSRSYSASLYRRNQMPGSGFVRVARLLVDREKAVTARFVRLLESGELNNDMILETEELANRDKVEENIGFLRSRLSTMTPGASMRSVEALGRVMSAWATAMDRWPLCFPGVLDEGVNRSLWRVVFGNLLRSTAISFSRRRVPQVVCDQRPQVQTEQLGQLETFDREPLLVLKRRGTSAIRMEIEGIEILSFDSSRMKRAIGSPELMDLLRHNGLDLARDWSNLKHEEAIRLLQEADGYRREHASNVSHTPGYVFGVDNFLKMMAIHTRLSLKIGVVIMGETGCGKTSLLVEMCNVLSWRFDMFRIHGGVDRRQVELWMQKQIDAARDDPRVRRLAFLDEVNTADCMSVFKQIICDRILQGTGTLLPDNLHVVACCNPYRIKSKGTIEREERDGLLPEAYFSETSVVKYRQGSGPFRDPLRHLVYRVHPLPDALLDFVFDFGALTSSTEAAYIQSIVAEKICNHGILANSIASMLHECQEVTRTVHENERSVVSLRDVSRFLTIMEWALKHWRHFEPRWDQFASLVALDGSLDPSFTSHEQLSASIALSALFCYFSRLTLSQRDRFVEEMSVRVGQKKGLHDAVKMVWSSRDRWDNLVGRVQNQVADAMNLGPGIARNSALLENVTVLTLGIFSRTPTIVVGKPGSSKSLAMSLIRQSIRGPECQGPLSNFPAVSVFSYQCSPFSTSEGIERVFSLADKTEQSSTDTATIQVILLDEIGLAEQSPHLPLKVLHKLLDERAGRVAVVGLSNWALDPAKMNRAVHLFRQAPSEQDLTCTARALTDDPILRRHLINLARAYYHIYKTQKQEDFFGLRDFYSLIRTMGTLLENDNRVAIVGENHENMSGPGEDVGRSRAICPQTLAKAVLSNFGGRPQEETHDIMRTFFDALGVNLPVSIPGTEELVRANLTSTKHNLRHLLLLTSNDAALNLLFERNILSSHKTTVIIGSDFEGDQDEMMQYDALEKIKCSMSTGETVVLLHCERLYESLYDVLNQHYTSFGDQTYTRLAFGPESQACYIHDSFRLCVIVDAADAYSSISPALLNRFEKQVLDRRTLLTAKDQQAISVLQEQVLDELCMRGMVAKSRMVAGFHDGLLASLVQLNDTDMATLTRRLLSCCTVETMCLLARPAHATFRESVEHATGIDPVECFFDHQKHLSFHSLLKQGNLTERTMVLTYCAYTNALRSTSIVLHSIDSEKELRRALTAAISSGAAQLILQCDCELSTRRRILQVVYAIDSVMNERQTASCDILLILHLTRGSSSSQFMLEFSDLWDATFVDMVSDDPSEIDLRVLSLTSIEDVIKGNCLDLSQSLRRCFRRSILRVIYPWRRTDDLIRNQIELLDDLIGNEPRFVDLVRAFSLRMIEQHSAVRTHVARTWNLLESKVPLGSLLQTYQDAFDSIIEPLFGLLLAYAERNCCLDLLHDRDQRNLWFSLAHRALLDNPKVGVRYSAQFGTEERFQIVGHQEDANRPAFRCKTPFCANIHEIMSSSRTLWIQLEQSDSSDFASMVPTFLRQDHFSASYLQNFAHDLYFLMFARRAATGKFLQDRVVPKGPELFLALLRDLADLQVLSFGGLYSAVWMHENVLDACFEVIRLLSLENLSLKEAALQTMLNEAVEVVSWKPQHEGARQAIARLIDIGDLVPPPRWEVIQFASQVLREAPHCDKALEIQVPKLVSTWTGDPFVFELPVDAYLAVPCSPDQLLRQAAISNDASIDQNLSVLHGLAKMAGHSQNGVDTVKMLLAEFGVSARPAASDAFTASSVLFLAENSHANDSLSAERFVQPDSTSSSWFDRISEYSKMHRAICQAAKSLDPELLQTLDKKVFIHCEPARWLFWRSLANEKTVSGVDEIIQRGDLRHLQLSALHNVVLPMGASIQPPFNPFGPIDGRVFAAASCGGEASDVLKKAWKQGKQSVALSVATYWWRVTTDQRDVSGKGILAMMMSSGHSALPLERGLLWGLSMETAVEILLVYAIAFQKKAIKTSPWNSLREGLHSNNFMPGLPDDQRRTLLQAVKDGTSINQCPNGHLYVIGDCGQPVATSRCPTCGSTIGGQSYAAAAGNSKVDLPAQQELRGYFLGRLQQDDSSAFGGDRGHTPVIMITLQALLHTGALVHTDCQWMRDNMNNTGSIEREFGGDWRAFAVHQLSVNLTQLARVVDVERDEAVAMFIELVDSLFTGSFAGQISFVSAPQRLAWEQGVAQLIPNFIARHLAARAMAKFPVQAEGREGLNELLNILRCDPDYEGSGSFWRPIMPFERRFVTEQVLHDRMERHIEAAEADLIHFVLEHERELRGLGHVPGAVRWLTLCHNAFDLRVTRASARELDVKSVLSDRAWDDSPFLDFCSLWSSLFPKVQYECMQIPEALRNMTMDASSSLAFSLLSDEDEGLCVRAVIQRVEQIHNDLVQLARKVVKDVRLDHLDDWIPLRLVDSTQIASLEISNVWSYAERACFNPCACKESKSLNLSKLSRFVAGSVSCKPLIRCQVPAVRFVGRDTSGSGALNEKLNQLLNVIAEAEFRETHRLSLERELHNAEVANRDLQTLQTILQFIADTQESSEELTNLKLETFAVNVLRMPKPVFISTTLASLGTVKHGPWLLRKVAMLSTDDPTAGVLSKYNQELGSDLEVALTTWLDNTDREVLVKIHDVLALICREYLTQGNLSNKEQIGMLLSMREELDEVDHRFPSGFLCQHAVPVMKFLVPRVAS